MRLSLIQGALPLGHVVCRLKSNKRVEGDINVSGLAAAAEYREVKIEVREKEKVYLASEHIVERGKARNLKEGEGQNPKLLHEHRP